MIVIGVIDRLMRDSSTYSDGTTLHSHRHLLSFLIALSPMFSSIFSSVHLFSSTPDLNFMFSSG